jgi:hypothetical protein
MESKAHHGRGVISLETPSSLGRLVVVAVDCIGLEEAPYPCEHCSRSFLSKQALGGHQNAHRLERTANKRKRSLREVAPSSPEPPPAVNLLAAVGADLCGAYDPVSAVAPVVNWTWAWDQDKGEAAAAPAPEMDLTLRLWSG